MNDRYHERYPDERARREQRAGIWRDEAPDQYWMRRERFGADRYDRGDAAWERRTDEPYRDRRDEGEREHHFSYGEDAAVRGGTWSVGHGGGTGHGYAGGLGSWEPRRDERHWYAGRGPKNYRRPDDRILDEVNESLTAHPDVDATEIQVGVRDGEVTLEGTVETREEKRLAEDSAWKVPGVREVHNRMRVNALDRSGERGGAFRT